MTQPSPFNLSDHVLLNAGADPDKIALAILGSARAERWSYARLRQGVACAAGGLLAAGLRSGDKLLLRLGNSATFPVAFLGAIRAGIIPVPSSAALTAPEVAALVQAMPPDAILAEPDIALPDPLTCRVLLPDVLDGPKAPTARTEADDLAYVVFTSGSSGRPKPVAHAHRAILARRMMWDGWYGLRANDRLLHAGAFNWTYTLGTGLMDPWSIGATALVPAPGTDPAALALLAKRHDATILAGSPGIFRKLLHGSMPALPRLRHGLSAGEALAPSLRTRWRAVTGTDIFEALGMSECSTFLSGCPARPAPEGTMGFAQSGRRIAILDDKGAELPDGVSGILAVHRDDPGLMLGYIDGPTVTLPLTGDWFETGDIASRDADGAFSYHGRRDDILTAGGFRISPLEIEAAFENALGLTDCAALTLHPNAETAILALAYTGTAGEVGLAAHAAARLAPHKRPRAYLQLPGLPRGTTGKLDRRAVALAVKDLTR